MARNSPVSWRMLSTISSSFCPLLAADGFAEGLGDVLHILADGAHALHEAVQPGAGLAGDGGVLGQEAGGRVAGVQLDVLLAQDADGAERGGGVLVDLELLGQAEGDLGPLAVQIDGDHRPHLHPRHPDGALHAQPGHLVEFRHQPVLGMAVEQVQLFHAQDQRAQDPDGEDEEGAYFGFEFHGRIRGWLTGWDWAGGSVFP